ncbi:MAG: MATE family efflux transporter [Ruminococcaceae bacterium]|nr:MATE family efflux transporter [Oscillospiraceae bacterium]
MAARISRGYTMDMTNGSLAKQVLIFAIPLALSNLLQLLFNAADLVVVSRFAGDNCMAAVGANGPLVNMMVRAFTGISVGANVLAARERGAGETEDLSRTVHTAMTLSLVGGLILIGIGLLGTEWILDVMDVPDNIRPLAAAYLRIYMLGMPAQLIYNFGSSLLRAVGDTRRSLYYLTFAGVVNVCLNLFLVIVFQLDVEGVAIATVASHVISAVLVVRCLLLDDGDVRLHIGKLHIHLDKLKEIMRIGLPAALQNCLFSISNVMIQSSVNSFGEVVIAGHSASNNIQGFFQCITMSMSNAVLSFTSQNLGAKKVDRVRKLMLVITGYLAVCGVVVAVVSMNWGHLLLGIYTKTPEVIEVGLMEFRYMLLPFFALSMMNMLASAVRGLGLSTTSMIVALVGVCGFRFVWITTLFQIPQYHTMPMLILSYPVSWTLTSLAHLICWLIGFHRLKKRMVQADI